MYHVLPINDIDEHKEISTCHCQPEVQIEGGEMICIHNAFDRREMKEHMLSGKYPPDTEQIVHYFCLLQNNVISGRMTAKDFADRLRSFMNEYKKKYTVV